MATSKALRSLVAVTAVFTACWMIGMTAIAVALGFGRGLTRREGAVLIALYVVFAIVVATA